MLDHVDIAIRAILGAQAAADAPVLDDDLARLVAADRAHRAADHAIGVEARAARAGHQELVEPQALADQPGHPLMRVGAGLGALVAARALHQVEDEQALGVHQPLIQEGLERLFVRFPDVALVFLQALAGLGDHGRADGWGFVEDRAEVVAA